MISIYGLKNCDSCRKTLKFLKKINLSYEFIDIKNNLLKKNKIKEWLSVHDVDKIINKKSTTWRQLDQNIKEKYQIEALTILEKFPTLIKRPFWEINSKASKQLEPGFFAKQILYLEKIKKNANKN